MVGCEGCQNKGFNPGLDRTEGEEEEEYGTVLCGVERDKESVDRGEWKELVFRKSSADGTRESRNLEIGKERLSVSEGRK